MQTGVLWASAFLACAMLFWPRSHNSAWFALAGTVLGGLYHFNIATVPEARTFALLLWAIALFLLAAKTLGNPLAHWRRRTV